MAQVIVPLLIGVGLLALGWFQFRKVMASRAWPAATGRIVAAKVGRETQQGDADEPDRTVFFPSIEYEYEAGGMRQRGNRIAFDQRTYSKPGEAEMVLEGFPVGGAVEVFYNPGKPGEAVLEKRGSSGVVLMAVGGLMSVLGLAAMARG